MSYQEAQQPRSKLYLWHQYLSSVNEIRFRVGKRLRTCPNITHDYPRDARRRCPVPTAFNARRLASLMSHLVKIEASQIFWRITTPRQEDLCVGKNRVTLGTESQLCLDKTRGASTADAPSIPIMERRRLRVRSRQRGGSARRMDCQGSRLIESPRQRLTLLLVPSRDKFSVRRKGLRICLPSRSKGLLFDSVKMAACSTLDRTVPK